MPEACMFDILALPEAVLRRILSKASTRTVAKLVAAYPRAVGRGFLEVLQPCTSAFTLDFLREEVNSLRTPSYPEIRQAEREIMKIIHEDSAESGASGAQPAISLAR